MSSLVQLGNRTFEDRPMIPAIRAIVAHGEDVERELLRSLLAEEAAVQVVAECCSADETISAVIARKPDLLLLDAQISRGESFQVLNQIPEELLPMVIFTSENDQHAVRAIAAGALDYLLAPFDRTRVHDAIERARLKLLNAHEHRLTHRILSFLAEAKAESPVERRLAVKAGGRVLLLDMNDIDWIEAAGNYVKLRVGGDSYFLREGIGRIAARLDPNRFVRIHRSTIVNVQRIKELHPCNNGEYMVVLRSGKELSCSRGYRSKLRQIISAP
jgi:two-component system, LytTR family, response regulator